MYRIIFGLLLASAALAQPAYRLENCLVDGGGRRSTDAIGHYIGYGSLHQATVGKSTGGSRYVTWVGFWHPRWVPIHRDAAVVEITSPSGTQDTIRVVTPSARLANFGNQPTTFPAWFVITRTNGEPYYRDSVSVTLGPGDVLLKTFDTLHFASGLFVARCSVGLTGDEDPGNDVQAYGFKVRPRQLPQGWARLSPMPAMPSAKAIKAGGWLAYIPAQGRIYGAKGNKTRDFYSYDPAFDNWQTRDTIPAGVERKLPGAGAVGVGDGNGSVYALKGNGSFGFWRYDVQTDSWHQLAPVPTGPRRKKVKAGADAVYVERRETGYVYVAKGGCAEFWRYNTFAARWDTMPNLPTWANAKWDKGSWLAYDNDRTIYAQQGKFHTLCRFDVVGDTWYSRACEPMPRFDNRTGKTTLAKDGSVGAWYDGCLYAFKGNNTQQFWRYSAARDSWTELETIPAAGNGRAVKVKTGADIVSCGDGSFIATKGNKSVELWRYCPGDEVVGPAPQGRSGVMAAEQVPVAGAALVVRPSIVVSDRAAVNWNWPGSAGRMVLTICDAAGRVAVRRQVTGSSGSLDLDVSHLSRGTYFVRLAGGTRFSEQQIVIGR
jgi:hypothetical protein